MGDTLKTKIQVQVEFMRDNLGELVSVMDDLLKNPNKNVSTEENLNIINSIKHLFNLPDDADKWKKRFSFDKASIPENELKDSFIYGDEGAIERFVRANSGKVELLMEQCNVGLSYKITDSIRIFNPEVNPLFVREVRKINQCRREVAAYRDYLYRNMTKHHPKFIELADSHEYPYEVTIGKNLQGNDVIVKFETKESYVLYLLSGAGCMYGADQNAYLDQKFKEDQIKAAEHTPDYSLNAIRLGAKKLKCLDEMLAILDKPLVNTFDTNQPLGILRDFQNKFNDSQPILTARRDSRFETFAKVILTILGAATLVAAYKIPSLWETEGSKLAKRVKPILNGPPSKRNR